VVKDRLGSRINCHVPINRQRPNLSIGFYKAL
jgi:hypothetical protein